MEIKDYIYTAIVIVHLVMLFRIRWEAAACDWSRQARWLSSRFSAIILAVFLLAIAAWTIFEHKDETLEFLMGLSICSMTVILYIQLPDVLAAMSDESVGEDVDIYIDGDDNN